MMTLKKALYVTGVLVGISMAHVTYASNTGTWPYDFGSFPYGVWEYRSTHYFNGGYPARQYGYYEYAYPYGTPYGYPQTYYYPYYVPRYRR